MEGQRGVERRSSAPFPLGAGVVRGAAATPSPAGRVGGQSCREAVTVRPRAEVKFLRSARLLVWSRTSLISQEETLALPQGNGAPVADHATREAAQDRRTHGPPRPPVPA